MTTATAMATIIRCSALPRYTDCGRRMIATTNPKMVEAAGFKLKRSRRGIGSLQGTAIHRGAEVDNTEKAKSGALPPLSVATDAAMDLLNEGLREEVEFDGPRGVTHNRRDAEWQTLSMVTSYHHLIAPQIEPLVVETKFEAEVSPGVILSGTPDIIAREPNAIRDLKTGTRGPGTFQAQIGGYSLLARSHGIEIEHGQVDYLRRVGRSKPQPPPEARIHRIADAETAAASILGHIMKDLRTFIEGDPERRIAPGDPWSFPANPSSILCSPKYCPAFGTEFCHEGDAGK